MDKLLAKDVSKGKIQQSDATEARERVTIVGEEGIKAMKDVDMVVEVSIIPHPLVASSDSSVVTHQAVSENPDLKASIFSELGRELNPKAILASNTSSISITKIASSTLQKGVNSASEEGKALTSRVVGLHFFNPVPVMVSLRPMMRRICPT
jgi:3-hydroxybutyryl-CoA dehydrogenase